MKTLKIIIRTVRSTLRKRHELDAAIRSGRILTTRKEAT